MAILIKASQNLPHVSIAIIRSWLWTLPNGRRTAPRPSPTAPPIQFRTSTLRLTTAIRPAMMVTTSSADLHHGTASEQALSQPRALRTPETAQGHATSRRLKTPTVNGNFTTSLARSILMARYIIWWTGFRPWCAAMYCERHKHSL